MSDRPPDGTPVASTGTFAPVRRAARSRRSDAHEVDVFGGRGVARRRVPGRGPRRIAGAGGARRVHRHDGRLGTTFVAPTAVKVLPGGDLLVLEKRGTFQRVAANGSVSPAGSITTNAGCTDGERGLLSAALDPTFATTGTIYVYATRPRPGGCANTLSKFTMSGGVVSSLRAGADRQHPVDGNQSQRRHGRGRPRRLPLPQCRRGRRHRAGPEPGLARGQDPANHDDGPAGAGQSVPHRRGPRSVCARRPVGRGVRRDLRPRAAQPVPYRVRPELGDDAVPDQRRRRRDIRGGRRRHRGCQLRLAHPGGAVPDRTDRRLLDQPEFHRPADRLPAHCRHVHRRWSLCAERLVGCRLRRWIPVRRRLGEPHVADERRRRRRLQRARSRTSTSA